MRKKTNAEIGWILNEKYLGKTCSAFFEDIKKLLKKIDKIENLAGKWLRFQTRHENDTPSGEFDIDEYESTEDVKVIVF